MQLSYLATGLAESRKIIEKIGRIAMSRNEDLRYEVLLLTQKMQRVFPQKISPDVVRAWNSCPLAILEARLLKAFGAMPASSIFGLASTVTIPATTERFVANNHFVVGTSVSAAVRISCIGSVFRRWLLGKVEELSGERSLRYSRLRKPLVDAPIIAELGEGAAETSLAEIWWLLEQQPNGEAGTLLVNGDANIFYVRDVDGIMFAVRVFWDDLGWFVDAISVKHPNPWAVGDRVFSRNPVTSDAVS
jgi:hypothetical protein